MDRIEKIFIASMILVTIWIIGFTWNYTSNESNLEPTKLPENCWYEEVFVKNVCDCISPEYRNTDFCKERHKGINEQ